MTNPDILPEVAQYWPHIKDIEKSNVDLSQYIQEAAELKLSINADPATTGLAAFHTLLQKVQAYRDRLSTIMMEVLSVKSSWELLYGSANAIYNRYRELFLQDTEIRSLRNSEMQTAAIRNRLTWLTGKQFHIEENLKYIDSILKILQQCEKNLESTNNNISRQITVIDYQIKIGEIRMR